MGTNTTARGYRYPDGVEIPALDILLGHLAQDVDADVQANVTRLAENVGTFAYAAGWANFDASAESLAVTKDADRWVTVTGHLRATAAAGAGVTSVTLGVGYRPPLRVFRLGIKGVASQRIVITDAGLLSFDSCSFASGDDAVIPAVRFKVA